jgi:uncharacterized protein YcfJ
MQKTAITTAVALLLATGCTVAPQRHATLVDYQQPGYSQGQYRQDDRECNDLARQRPSTTADGAVGGLLAGVLLGAIVGNAYGDTGHGAAYGAALGTASGGLHGAADSATTYKQIVRNCMIGRGYRVLD